MIDTRWDAIVLAGGRASRLGGIDKTALLFEGVSLLDRALAAATDACRVVVVGQEELRQRLPSRVELVTERPRFGGPAAALAAGLTALAGSTAQRVAVLAADLPYAGDAIAELLAIGRLAAHADGVVATDAEGRAQPLIAIYSTEALSRAVAAAEPVAGASMHGLIDAMVLCRVRLPSRLCADIDTPLAAELHGVSWRDSARQREHTDA